MVTVTVKPVKVSKTAVIVASWPTSACAAHVARLRGGCDGDESLQPEAAVLFALSELIRSRFEGNALDAARSKFTCARLDVQRGQAIMTFYTEPSFSAARKVLALFEKYAQPGRLAQWYKKYVGNTKHFAHAANALAADMRRMQVFVTGWINMPEGKHLEFELPAHEKVAEDGKLAAHVMTPAVRESVPTSSALEAHLVTSLFASMNVPATVIDGHVVPALAGSHLATLVGKIDKDRISKFIEQKFTKMGAKLHDTMLFTAAASGYFSAADLSKMPASFTAAAMTATLQKALKQ